jgi:peptidoglycan-associated lipoprotein
MWAFTFIAVLLAAVTAGAEPVIAQQTPPTLQEPERILPAFPPVIRLEQVARVQFESRSSVLPLEAAPMLDALAAELVRHPTVLCYVEGHTDDVEAPDHDAALVLSEMRALAVRDYLVARGVAADRLGPIGRGMRWPRVLGTRNEDAAREANRRVEIKYRDDRRP